MVLSRQTIQKLINEGKLVINPFDEKYLGSCSYDLHLGENAMLPETNKEVKLNPNLVLHVDDFVLVETIEYLSIPNDLVGHISTRSKAARIGLLVHFGSELVHPGSSGRITLEIKNLSNKEILLQKNLSLAQIYFEVVDRSVEGKTYNNLNGIDSSDLCEEIKV